MNVEQIKARHDAVQELKKSFGWTVLKEAMQEEINAATRSLVEPKNYAEKDIYYLRGLMKASYACLEAPDKLLLKLQNELLFAMANAQKEDDGQDDKS